MGMYEQGSSLPLTLNANFCGQGSQATHGQFTCALSRTWPRSQSLALVYCLTDGSTRVVHIETEPFDEARNATIFLARPLRQVGLKEVGEALQMNTNSSVRSVGERQPRVVTAQRD